MPELYLDRINTPKGVFLILFSSEGIYEIFFPGSGPELEYRHRKVPWTQLAADLNRYLAGEEVDWGKYPLDCSGYPPFTAAVLKEVKKLPWGRVCSYRSAAGKAGSPLAWRAAGQALKANRHPIIVPCHRVVASDGKPGGFSGPPGWKQMLLELEGAIAPDSLQDRK